jgi:P27 family predicted phage terminase small subunit
MPRPRKSLDRLLLEGTFDRSRHAKRGLAPHGGAALDPDAAPASLSPRQAYIWREVITSLPRGLAAQADRFLIEAYVMALDDAREANRMVNLEGRTAIGSQGQPVASPHLRVRTAAMMAVAAIGSRLGLDPQSRLRMSDAIQPEPPPPDPHDPWSVFEAARVTPTAVAARRRRGDA